VEILPDSADPMDIRYNMINWVHRSTRGWSYGASVSDPRTGEIIKGNVTLGSLRVRQDYLIAQGLLAPFESGKPLDFLNVDGQNAKKALNEAIKKRTTTPKKLSYEDLVRKSYEKNGGAIKSKMKKGGMIKMKKK
jgi:hypothetical protein